MGAIKTYSAAEVIVAVGIYYVSDFESITVEQDDDDWTMVVGTAGEISRGYTANHMGRITIVAPQTNAINLSLSSILNTKAVVPVYVKDNNGYSLHLIGEATLLKPPTSEYAKVNAGSREWVFVGKLLSNTIGGN
jgi:hypothetical protein